MMVNQKAPQLLDHLDLAVLGLNAQYRPLFLSSRAAKLLLLRDRDQLDEYAGQLSPLIDLARRELSEERARPGLAASTRIEELQLSTTDGLPVSVLAYARNLTGEGGLAKAIIFFDRGPYEPFFTLLEQSRRLRPGVILTSALVGKALGDGDLESLNASLRNGGEAVAAHGSPRVHVGGLSTDVTQALTAAVEIVDNLIAPTFKVSVDGGASALIRVPGVPVLRILAHAVLEAADFTGPFGRARLGAFLRDSGVNVIVLGSRPESLPAEMHPLEMYLVKKSMPSEYRVVRGETRNSDSPSFTADERNFLELAIGKERMNSVHLQGSIPTESYSANLRLTNHLSKVNDVVCEAKLLPPQHLMMSFLFPLAG